jgi:hypothetical protein
MFHVPVPAAITTSYFSARSCFISYLFVQIRQHLMRRALPPGPSMSVIAADCVLNIARHRVSLTHALLLLLLLRARAWCNVK